MSLIFSRSTEVESFFREKEKINDYIFLPFNVVDASGYRYS
jgi:hypothetical protein